MSGRWFLAALITGFLAVDRWLNPPRPGSIWRQPAAH